MPFGRKKPPPPPPRKKSKVTKHVCQDCGETMLVPRFCSVCKKKYCTPCYQANHKRHDKSGGKEQSDDGGYGPWGGPMPNGNIIR